MNLRSVYLVLFFILMNFIKSFNIILQLNICFTGTPRRSRFLYIAGNGKTRIYSYNRLWVESPVVHMVERSGLCGRICQLLALRFRDEAMAWQLQYTDSRRLRSEGKYVTLLASYLTIDIQSMLVINKVKYLNTSIRKLMKVF